MKSSVIAGVIALFMCMSSVLHAEDELGKLKASYQKARKDKVVELNKSYLKALEKLKTRLTKKGKLDSALMVKKEIEIVQEENEDFLNPEKTEEVIKKKEEKKPRKRRHIPKDAVRNGNSWYKVYKHGTSWEHAFEICRQKKGRLVEIPNQETNDFLKELIQPHMDNQWTIFWIGASDDNKEKKWQWLSGAKMGYINWRENEPNNLGWGEGADVEAHHAFIAGDGTWLDCPHDWPLDYICEWPDR